MIRSHVRSDLLHEEKRRDTVYPDGEGTAGGIGHNMDNKVPPEAYEAITKEPSPTGKPHVLPEQYRKVGTIIPDAAIDAIFEYDIDIAIRDAQRFALAPSLWDKLGDVRREVLVNMSFNLGYPRLSGFVKFQQALLEGDYETAADEMLDSKWARDDVPNRAKRLARIMRTGNYEKPEESGG